MRMRRVFPVVFVACLAVVEGTPQSIGLGGGDRAVRVREVIVRSTPAVTLPVPFAYYALEEASGNLLDEMGVRHLTSIGGAGTITYRVTGKNGYAISLDSDSWALLNSDFPNSAAHSISAWCKFTGTTSSITAMFGTTMGTPVMMVGRENTTFGLATGPPGPLILTGGTAGRSAGVFYHLVYVFNGTTTHELYVNGELDTTQTQAGSATGDFILNNTPSGTDHVLDEVAWFDTVLTADQIRYLYNGGAGKFYPY